MGAASSIDASRVQDMSPEELSAARRGVEDHVSRLELQVASKTGKLLEPPDHSAVRITLRFSLTQRAPSAWRSGSTQLSR